MGSFAACLQRNAAGGAREAGRDGPATGEVALALLCYM
jgi:hypothetical protein